MECTRPNATLFVAGMERNRPNATLFVAGSGRQFILERSIRGTVWHVRCLVDGQPSSKRECANYLASSVVYYTGERVPGLGVICSSCRDAFGRINLSNSSSVPKKTKPKVLSKITKEPLETNAFSPYKISIPIPDAPTEKLFKSALAWVKQRACASDRMVNEFLKPLWEIVKDT